VRQVEVPEVYGATVADARAILDDAGLGVIPVEVPGEEVAGTALSTKPRLGALVDPGSTVTLYYSAGPEPTVVSPEPTTVEPDAPGPSDPNQRDGNGNRGPGSVLENARENVRENGNVPRGERGGGGNGEDRSGQR
jgi:beta-lactam-binding protein with PASTA domain